MSQTIHDAHDHPLGPVIAGLRAVQAGPLLSDRSIEAVYTLAFESLQGGRFGDARTAFEFLTGQRPAEARFWAGLGYSLLEAGEAENAMPALVLATGLAPDNAGYMMGLAQCCAVRSLVGHAAYAYGIAAAMAESQGHQDLADRARARLELMGYSA